MGRWRIGVVPAMKRRVRGRVAFRARRQITKTKPSIREETGGPAHSIALRGVHTHVPSRARARRCGSCACARVCSRLASLVVNLEACGRVYASGSRDLARKEREGWAARGLSSMWAGRGPGQRSPRSRNQFNDRPWSETGVGGRGGGIFLDDTGAGLTWAREIVDDGTEGYGGGWMDLMSLCL